MLKYRSWIRYFFAKEAHVCLKELSFQCLFNVSPYCSATSIWYWLLLNPISHLRMHRPRPVISVSYCLSASSGLTGHVQSKLSVSNNGMKCCDICETIKISYDLLLSFHYSRLLLGSLTLAHESLLVRASVQSPIKLVTNAARISLALPHWMTGCRSHTVW